MPHPNGGQGNPLALAHTFAQAYQHVGNAGVAFISTTGEQMTATQGMAQDNETTTIVLTGERNIHGRVCHACWGFPRSCTGERVGQAVSPFDAGVP